MEVGAVRALVVYESAFGNTAEVARAVWEGVSQTVPDASLVEAGAAPAELPDDLELLVVGAPTHAFGMSRPGTRDDARRQGGDAPTVGVREWLGSLARTGYPVHAATFDTRVDSPRLPGSAAAGARRALRRAGFDCAAATSFWVGGIKGPLRDGELDRARSWGATVTGPLTSSSARG
ncbi:flavodoxin [Cellulomonas biazotea]|uniref:Flavodoxin n=1 Tax=Cellulomonas biazotea TaxID=1709 RepID=A0A402DTN6_9CELL|nr:flavodoxin [Cellulomonas biazotea]